jgi:hypothetical protein
LCIRNKQKQLLQPPAPTQKAQSEFSFEQAETQMNELAEQWVFKVVEASSVSGKSG